MKKLVIIPAYNEQDNILEVINDIKKHAPSFEYIVINDGSTDGTGRVCAENNIDCINLIQNLGIGGAVQTGYIYALRNGYDAAVQMDGDGQHNAKYLDELVHALESGSNMVIGSRYMGKKGFQSSLMRRVGKRYFTFLIRVLCHTVVSDPTSGFRACDRKLIEKFARNYPTDYPEPETIVAALKDKYVVKEVSVRMNKRVWGESSINLWKSVYYMVKVSMAIIFTYVNRGK